MCLTRVTAITNRKRKGWKVFSTRRGELLPLFYRFKYTRKGTSIPEEQWEEDPSTDEFTSKHGSRQIYRTGFHIFLNKEHAEDYASIAPGYRTIRRVRFRKVVAQGLQRVRRDLAPTVVAKEIYVEKG